MRDMKAEKGLGGDSNWPHISFVSVPGVKGTGGVIGEWHTIAVLEAQPLHFDTGSFQIGFKNGHNAQRLRWFIETFDGKFGMRIGSEDVEFFAIPFLHDREILLRLVEVTTEDDPKYADLPLY